MNPDDRPSSNASGAAAIRQRQQPSSAPDQEQPATEERAARVAKLREQYQRGDYQIDAAQLSAEIVNRHLKQD